MPVSKKLLCSIFMGCTLSLSVIITSMQVKSTFAEPNFGAAGDWGCSSNTGKTVSNIRSHSGPERVLGLGDYSYTSTPTCWLNIIDPIKSRMRITIGNHEDDSNEGFSQYMSAFGLSSTVYAFTYGNVRFIVMDSDRNSFSSGSSQHSFVKSQLQSASQNSAIKWIIVYIHKPFYTAPNTCDSSGCTNTGSTARNLRNTYHPLFDQYGVDVVLAGHVHNYQRTFPLKYDPGSPDSPTRTSTATTDYFDPVGQIYAIVGTGGVGLFGLGSKPYFVKYQQDDRFGALDINIENNGYTLAGRYYTNDGVKRDVFKITKTGTAQYNFGPSLSLSGEEASLTSPGDNVQSQNSPENGIFPGQINGQGKGLNCEHFTQQGPVRCRLG